MWNVSLRGGTPLRTKQGWGLPGVQNQAYDSFQAMQNVTVPPSQNLPASITATKLWMALQDVPEYCQAIIEIRKVAASLAATISTLMPEYTDHSVLHMDCLWRVGDAILTEPDAKTLTSGEALVLGASFYLHDLGMALAATAAGKAGLKNSEPYKVVFARLININPGDEAKAESLALREATRQLHAAKASELASEIIPGLDRYLIENSDFRQRWAFTIGQIAASHHWTMEEVEQRLGTSKVTPGPDGENLDLGYVACLLRVIDYAHIDRNRAAKLERKLRPDLPIESAKHWDAQENITGPLRAEDYLVYGCTQPINDINGWWLFYDTAKQLDSEIRIVYEYLKNRVASKDRFSLRGVRAVETPASFVDYVRLSGGIAPIDIRVQPDSMERIVELLGGPQIYGPDELAPIRELIQNARDAIQLRYAMERAEDHPHYPGEIIIRLDETAQHCALEVVDNGVGMTRGIVHRHLVGVGSDFWNSIEFYSQYRKALDAGFKPIGKFGIGFLSVFMLGTHVEVETESRGNKRIKLSLDGLGKRGELREVTATGRTGTRVRVSLKRKYGALMAHLAQVVRARAPMLDIPILIHTDKNGARESERIEPDWWKRIPLDALVSFVRNWRPYSFTGRLSERNANRALDRYADIEHYGPSVNFGGKWTVKGWPGAKPQALNDTERVVSQGGEPSPGVIVCSQGIAVSQLRIPDVTGMVEIGPVALTVSRAQIAERGLRRDEDLNKVSELREKILESLRPVVVERMDELASHGMIPGRISFIRGLALTFGTSLLDVTKLKWIPVFIPPGNMVLHSKNDLVEALKEKSRLSLTIGVGASGTYSVTSSHIPYEDLSQMVIVSISREEVDVGYDIKKKFEREGLKEVLTGTLDQLIELVSDDGDIEETKQGLVFTNFLLRCVADSWRMRPETLRGQQWYLHYNDNVLLADLRKL
jgi:hypothetical protein